MLRTNWSNPGCCYSPQNKNMTERQNNKAEKRGDKRDADEEGA